MFDAKRADLYDQSCDDIDSFARDIEAQIETELTEKLKDLTSVNIMMQKQQLIETQMIVKSQQMTVARKGAFVKDVLILDTFSINYPTAPIIHIFSFSYPVLYSWHHHNESSIWVVIDSIRGQGLD